MALKIGDRVKITEKSEYYRKDAIAQSNNPTCKGVINKIYHPTTKDLNIQVNWDNKTNNAYNSRDLELVKTKEMVTKKVVKKSSFDWDSIHEGDYFKAEYKDGTRWVPIRGVIEELDICDDGEHYVDVLLLATSSDIKSFYNEACDDDDNAGFKYSIKIYGKNIDKSLRNFEICKDKRQIAVIEKDKCPVVLEGYTSKYDKKTQIFTFGCGAVKLTEVQVKQFIQYLKIKDIAQTIYDMAGANISYGDLDDITIEEVKEILKLKTK